MKIEIDEAFRTDDIVLSTLLHVQGYEAELERLTNRKVVWVFMPRDEALMCFVAEYESLNVRVEPLSFQRELAKVRNTMYDFLGVPGRRLTGPGASSASAA